MWNEKIIKIIPGALFLFCLLEVFELVLVINDLGKTEKLEKKLKNNLEMIDAIIVLLNKHGGLENFEYKKHR
ncbi:hypothetical protein E5P85_03195 [Helicobacter pylori]|nr:hypothetical protein E5P85_03195 [Helicobacter pylori]